MCVLLRDGVYQSISWHIILQADGCIFLCVFADKCNAPPVLIENSVRQIKQAHFKAIYRYVSFRHWPGHIIHCWCDGGSCLPGATKYVFMNIISLWQMAKQRNHSSVVWEDLTRGFMGVSV